MCGNGVVDAGEACEVSVTPMCENGYPCESCQCIPSTTEPLSTTEPPPTTDKAECGANKFTCTKGGPEQEVTTVTEWTWKCYIPGNPDGMVSCSKARAKCGANKFTCDGGTLGVQSTLPSVYTWTCVSGDESISCQIDRPLCGAKKNTCTQ